VLNHDIQRSNWAEDHLDLHPGEAEHASPATILRALNCDEAEIAEVVEPRTKGKSA
jgi:hypothetical protein